MTNLLHIEYLELVATFLGTIIASSGFWIYVNKKSDRKSLQSELLIGLAHDRIIYLGTKYITRGWIYMDEYENLNMYLYKPYKELGGNGSAQRLMAEIDKLPIRQNIYEIHKQGERNNDT